MASALDFSINQGEKTNLIYIKPSANAEELITSLVVTNSTDDKTIEFQGHSGTASSSNYHFKLRFHHGQLNDPSRIRLQTNGWSSHYQSYRQYDYIYFLATSSVSLNETTTLQLQNLFASGDPGTTDVSLLWNDNTHYVVISDGNENYDIQTDHTVNIANYTQQVYAPLHVGFVGSNTVLNDGKTANTLTLRLTNISNKPLTLVNGPKKATFTLHFDYDPAHNQDKEWALLDQNTASALGMSVTHNGTPWGDVARHDEGNQPIWTFSVPHSAQPLAPYDFIDVAITGIKTIYPTGQTNLYLHTTNTPDHWNGYYTAVIEKSPLIYRGARVGIGTNAPGFPLEVSALGHGIYQTHGEVQIGTYVNDSGGWLGTKSNHPLYFFTHNSSPRMTLDTSGNLGIGTATPQAKLDIRSANISKILDTFYKKSNHDLDACEPRSAWQSFTQNISGEIAGIAIYAYLRSDTYTVILYEGEGTAGKSLIEQKFEKNDSGQYEWVEFDFSSSVFLNHERKYTINISGNTTNRITWYFAEKNYPGGKSSEGRDLAFKTYMGVQQPTLNLNGLAIYSAQNKLGIGTATPQTTLDVQGNAAISGQLTVGSLSQLTVNGDSTLSGDLTIHSPSSKKRLIIDWDDERNGGDNFPLEVRASGYGIYQTCDGIQVGLYINSDKKAGYLGTKSQHDLYFFAHDSGPRMTLDKSGNLGIGTTSPSFPLEVSRDGYGIYQTNGSVQVGTYLNDNSGWLGTKSNHPLHFFTNNSSSRMILDTAGNLGIGTKHPTAKLDVDGDIKVSGSINSSRLKATVSNNNAIQARNNSKFPTIYSHNRSTDNSGEHAGIYADMDNAEAWGIGTNGKMAALGGELLYTHLPTRNGFRVVTSPISLGRELHFTGTDQLAAGSAKITFEEEVMDLLAEEEAYRILLTPAGQCQGLCVVQRATDGFVVEELNGGGSDVAFDWFVVAQRAVSHEDKTAAPMPDKMPEVPIPTPLLSK